MTAADIGLWCELGAADLAPRPALFLDRDGVIVADTNYLGRAEDVRMIEGVAAAISRCNALRIPVVVATNQSGIARGHYGWDGFRAVQAAISEALAASGARLDGVLACAYHAEGLGPLRIADHPWRKPNPGMILAAGKRMNLDLSRSWIVGDKATDLAAAAAGLAGGTLVSADERERERARLLASKQFSVETAANSAAAILSALETGRLLGSGPS
ncbi:MAG TPA: HAD-IIIA family hydrolase [Xanthobacteraceae bacterium]|nr:HAD-IIIA family hydrolase [Xanthobacteraceae bacterium]